MKKIIICLTILIVGIASAVTVYFVLINQEKSISITSYDKTVTLDLGMHKASNYKKKEYYAYNEITFQVKKIEEFKANVKKNEYYRENFSSNDVYIYRINDHYFSVEFSSNYVKLSLVYRYWPRDEIILFTFPNGSGVSDIFGSMDENLNLKITYRYMLVTDFDEFKEFYRDFDPLTCKIQDEDTVLLKGYDYRDKKPYKDLVIEFKRDTDGVIANWSTTSIF